MFFGKRITEVWKSNLIEFKFNLCANIKFVSLLRHIDEKSNDITLDIRHTKLLFLREIVYNPFIFAKKKLAIESFHLFKK